MKIIKVKDCVECPYLGRTSRFNKTGLSRPCCSHPLSIRIKGADPKNRLVPHQIEYSEFTEDKFNAIKGIPEWCPLENEKIHYI